MPLLQSLLGQLLGGSSTPKKNKDFGLDEDGNPIEGQNPYEDPNFITKLFFPQNADYESKQNAEYSNAPTLAARNNLISRSVWGKNAGDVQPYIGKDLTEVPPDIAGLMLRDNTSPTNIEAQRQAQAINANPNIFKQTSQGKLLGNVLNNMGLADKIQNNIPGLETASDKAKLSFSAAKDSGLLSMLPDWLKNEFGRIGSEMTLRPHEDKARIAEADRSSLLAPLSGQASANEYNRQINNSALLDSSFANRANEDVYTTQVRKELAKLNADDITHLLTTQRNSNLLSAAGSQYGQPVPMVSTKVTPNGVISGVNQEAINPEIAKFQQLMNGGLMGQPPATYKDKSGNAVPSPPKKSNLIYPINNQVTQSVSPFDMDTTPVGGTQPTLSETPIKDAFEGLFDKVSHEKKSMLFDALTDEVSKYIALPDEKLRYGGSAFMRDPKHVIKDGLMHGDKDIIDMVNKLPIEQLEKAYAKAIHSVAGTIK